MRKVLSVVLAATAVAGMSFPAGAIDTQQQAADTRGAQSTAVLKDSLAPAKEVSDMVKKPATPMELLENIKFALDRDLLLSGDFYTEENLKQFTGGNKVREAYDKKDKRNKWYGISDFGAMLEPVKDGGMSFDFRRTVQENGKTGVELSLFIRQRDDRMRFEDVEKLFGPSWQYSKEFIPDGMKLHSPTREHGNAWISYAVDSAKARGLMKLKFREDATLMNVNIFEGAK